MLPLRHDGSVKVPQPPVGILPCANGRRNSIVVSGKIGLGWRRLSRKRTRGIKPLPHL